MKQANPTMAGAPAAGAYEKYIRDPLAKMLWTPNTADARNDWRAMPAAVLAGVPLMFGGCAPA